MCTGSGPRRKELLRKVAHNVCEFIEDRWHKDSVYQQALSREGQTLDAVREWVESGPTIGDDQELYNLLRRKRESVFTGFVVISNAFPVDLTHASTRVNTPLQKHAVIRWRSPSEDRTIFIFVIEIEKRLVVTLVKEGALTERCSESRAVMSFIFLRSCGSCQCKPQREVIQRTDHKTLIVLSAQCALFHAFLIAHLPLHPSSLSFDSLWSLFRECASR